MYDYEIYCRSPMTFAWPMVAAKASCRFIMPTSETPHEASIADRVITLRFLLLLVSDLPLWAESRPLVLVLLTVVFAQRPSRVARSSIPSEHDRRRFQIPALRRNHSHHLTANSCKSLITIDHHWKIIASHTPSLRTEPRTLGIAESSIWMRQPCSQRRSLGFPAMMSAFSLSSLPISIRTNIGLPKFCYIWETIQNAKSYVSEYKPSGKSDKTVNNKAVVADDRLSYFCNKWEKLRVWE